MSSTQPAASAANCKDPGRKDQLAVNLSRVRKQILSLAQSAGVQPPELLPVTKFHPLEDVEILHQLGVKDVAENREQEARQKAEQLPQVRFHMIGQVQTKKANHVARWAASVHSLDSLKLAQALNRGTELAVERGQRTGALPVFIQVSADGDTSRGGVPLPNLAELVEQVEGLGHLELLGLMVVPPLNSEPRRVFGTVREHVDAWSARLGRDLKLSAGMSQDLAEAIESGSNIVRVGTGIMGPRPLA